jgi:capsular exopolysaccharide synthesis family protein
MKNSSLDDIIDFKVFFNKIIRNWFLLLISLLIAFASALTFNRYSTEFFNVNASIIVKEENSQSTSDLLYEKSFFQKNSLESKQLMLKSYPMIYKTLEDLRFDISYFIEGNIKVTETYDAPILVRCKNTNSLKGKKFKISVITEDSFSFVDLSNQKERIIKFNEEFLYYDVKMSIAYNIKFSQNLLSEVPNTIVKFYNLQSLSLSYQKKLLVSRSAKGSTSIDISILAEDEKKGVVFLNKLIDNCISNELLQKNLASKNTVDFINLQLVKMSDSLAMIEQQIQDYKNKNRVTDLSLKSQSIYTNIVSLETELAKTKTMNNYFDYLNNYLIRGDNLEGVSVPTSFGVNDANLNALISQLVEVQIKKNILIEGGQVKNPAIVQYNRQTKQLVLNLQEAISTSKSANNLLLTDYQKRIVRMEKSLSIIPTVEMELLNIERLQEISEHIYIFLLQKRAEAKINLSSNTSDTRVLEPAIYFNKNSVSPKKKRTYVIALLLGLFIPVLILLILDLINNKITTRSALAKLTNIPILAIIAKNYGSYELISKQNPKSPVYEGFRALRSNLDFLNTSKDNKVYLVTSSVSGEGKTYIAENLSIVFAKSGKKTLVIGGDLRRPKLYADFGFDNSKGLTNYVLADLALSEVILKSDIQNLDVLTSGPIPANPADALLTDKFASMMEELRGLYDVIVIDTPPLGLVADTLTLMKYSDENLYVTRQDFTKEGLLTYANDMYEKKRLGNLHLIFNDVKEGDGAYGYGYGYGYGYSDDYLQSEYFDNTEKLNTDS